MINKLIYGDKEVFMEEKTKELENLCSIYLNSKKENSEKISSMI